MPAGEDRHVSLLRLEALPVFEPTQLLERIDRDVAVRTDSYLPAFSQVCRQRKNAVAKISLGARTQTNDGTGFCDRRYFVWFEMRCGYEAPVCIDI